MPRSPLQSGCFHALRPHWLTRSSAVLGPYSHTGYTKKAAWGSPLTPDPGTSRWVSSYSPHKVPRRGSSKAGGQADLSCRALWPRAGWRAGRAPPPLWDASKRPGEAPPPRGRPQETLVHRPKTLLPCLQRDGQQGEPTEGTEAGGRPEHCGSTGDWGRGPFWAASSHPSGGVDEDRLGHQEDTRHGTEGEATSGAQHILESVRGTPQALVWAPP